MQACVDSKIVFCFRKTHCNNCLRGIVPEHDCIVSVLCPQCDLMSYCSQACLEEDKPDHALECDLFTELMETSDVARIMVRLLLKLEDHRISQDETLPFSQGKRSFSDLLSHSDKMEDNDPWILKIFHSVQELIPQTVKSWEHFKEVYGKLVINSFEVSNDEDEKVGYALYLGPSILDHSCVPNAEVDFSGKRIIVKCKVNMNGIDLRKLFISYIDMGAETLVRRRKLKQYYHFDCFCERCLGIKLGYTVSEGRFPKKNKKKSFQMPF